MDERDLYVVPRSELDRLISLLRNDQHTVIGPTVREGVIVHDEIAAVADLPIGFGDHQSPGSYRGAHPVRTEGASRYRQWMAHKLSSWHEQFGTSGCAGCGRCRSTPASFGGT